MDSSSLSTCSSSHLFLSAPYPKPLQRSWGLHFSFLYKPDILAMPSLDSLGSLLVSPLSPMLYCVPGFWGVAPWGPLPFPPSPSSPISPFSPPSPLSLLSWPFSLLLSLLLWTLPGAPGCDLPHIYNKTFSSPYPGVAVSSFSFTKAAKLVPGAGQPSLSSQPTSVCPRI